MEKMRLQEGKLALEKIQWVIVLYAKLDNLKIILDGG